MSYIVTLKDAIKVSQNNAFSSHWRNSSKVYYLRNKFSF